MHTKKDSDHKEMLYLERAKNELDLAKAIFQLSTNNRLKLEFELKEDATFFSNVIGNSYYCIFYSAKAVLQSKSKRGKFTYKKLPQANSEPTKESLNNAEKFFKNINLILMQR